jgi:hypothetical protein
MRSDLDIKTVLDAISPGYQHCPYADCFCSGLEGREGGKNGACDKRQGP